MAVNIGPRIGIDGEAEYRKQINNIIQDTKTLKSEYEALTSQFDKGKQSLSQNRDMHRILGEEIDAQKGRVERLKDMVEKSAEKFGEADPKTQRWKEALNDATRELNKLEGELEDLPSDFELIGRKMDESAKKIGNYVDDIQRVIRPVAQAIEGVFLAVVGGVATGIFAVTQAAFKGYAEQEQLVGGIETLFKESSNKVLDYANSAYKTAGMSANQYMDLATNFSARLISSLEGDTEKAADITDMAITDMADNMNKMGSDAASLENAYNGFAKANFTMLDNLKIGYGGTKEEMQRLLDDAEKLSGVHYDIDNLADIYEAIHIIQGELGITGTTAEEAEHTVAGSFGNLKSAWENLINGLGNEKLDTQKLIDNLVEAFNTAVDNALPVFDRIFTGLGDAITKIAPIIEEKLPVLLEKIKPTVEKAFQTLGETLSTLLPETLKTDLMVVGTAISDMVLQLSNAWNNLSTEQKTALLEGMAHIAIAIPVVSKLLDVIKTITTVVSGISAVLSGGIATVVAGIAGIGIAVAAVIDMIKNGWSLISTILEAVGLAIAAVAAVIVVGVSGVAIAIAAAVAATVFAITQAIILIKDHWTEITNFFKQMIDSWVAWWKALCAALGTQWQNICNTVKNLWSGVTNTLSGFFNTLQTRFSNTINNLQNSFTNFVRRATGWGRDLMDNFIDGIRSMWDRLVDTVSDIADTIADYLGFSEPEKGPLSNFHTYAPDMMKLFAKGIRDNENVIQSQIERSFDFSGLATEAFTTQATPYAYMPDTTTNNSVSIGSTQIVINATEGQSVYEIADAVDEIINQRYQRAQAAWA